MLEGGGSHATALSFNSALLVAFIDYFCQIFSWNRVDGWAPNVRRHASGENISYHPQEKHACC